MSMCPYLVEMGVMLQKCVAERMCIDGIEAYHYDDLRETFKKTYGPF